MMLPAGVTTPSRSPSPSNASPSSQSPCASRATQVLEILRLRRIGMVIREIAVDVAEELDDVAAEAPDTARVRTRRRRRCRNRRRCASAARAGCRRRCDRVYARAMSSVRSVPLPVASSPRSMRVRSAWMSSPDSVVAVDHHLEAVVVGRIVAARHHHAATGAEMLRGEIRHRRRDHADVDHVDAGGADAVARAPRSARAPTGGRRGRRRSCRACDRARGCRAPGRWCARSPASACGRRCRGCRRP